MVTQTINIPKTASNSIILKIILINWCTAQVIKASKLRIKRICNNNVTLNSEHYKRKYYLHQPFWYLHSLLIQYLESSLRRRANSKSRMHSSKNYSISIIKIKIKLTILWKANDITVTTTQSDSFCAKTRWLVILSKTFLSIDTLAKSSEWCSKIGIVKMAIINDNTPKIQ